MNANLTECVSNADLRLTQVERQLVADFRAMQGCAQQMIVDLSAQFKCTLPAERIRLILVAD